ncbi:MAG: hypothetical protein EXX96DRAFT_542926 [Benjaminiella poitrasii]|nr:MAG: hypothetical protein EXX96DRAFT_542926 [Benjaminiella poitrasii]
MAPPNTDAVIQEIEKLNLQEIARKQGHYLVYPDTKILVFVQILPKLHYTKNAEKILDLTPNIDTEIHGLQLSQLTDTQKDDLALLVAERGVVFFRNQDIDVYQAREFAKHYEPLHVHNTFGHPPGLPEVHVVHFDTNTLKRFKSIGGVDLNLRNAADGWHSDVSYEQQPPGLTLLKIDTGQQQVDEAHNAGHVVRRKTWIATHPIVRTHPVTGWKALYIQPGFTQSIVGLSRHESDTILNYLFYHLTGGVDFQVRFKWEENSVAVWDNRVTNHNAIFDYLEIGARHGWRVTPQAEVPYLDPNSKSRTLIGQEFV